MREPSSSSSSSSASACFLLLNTSSSEGTDPTSILFLFAKSFSKEKKKTKTKGVQFLWQREKKKKTFNIDDYFLKCVRVGTFGIAQRTIFTRIKQAQLQHGPQRERNVRDRHGEVDDGRGASHTGAERSKAFGCETVLIHVQHAQLCAVLQRRAHRLGTGVADSLQHNRLTPPHDTIRRRWRRRDAYLLTDV